MALSKLTKDMAIIQKLDDEPNDVGGLTAAQLKAKFDEAGEAIKTYLNDVLIPAIPMTAVSAVTLTASGWNAAAKQQTVTAAGVLADETAQLIQPTPSAASQAAYIEAGILCTGQAADSLTFTAAAVPTEDLTVYVVITEVTT